MKFMKIVVVWSILLTIAGYVLGTTGTTSGQSENDKHQKQSAMLLAGVDYWHLQTPERYLEDIETLHSKLGEKNVAAKNAVADISPEEELQKLRVVARTIRTSLDETYPVNLSISHMLNYVRGDGVRGNAQDNWVEENWKSYLPEVEKNFSSFVHQRLHPEEVKFMDNLENFLIENKTSWSNWEVGRQRAYVHALHDLIKSRQKEVQDNYFQLGERKVFLMRMENLVN